MFLIDKQSGDLLRVEDVDSLSNPLAKEVLARDQAGEEEQDWETISKERLIFPSGESLPRCWVDCNYQKQALRPNEAAQD